MDDLSLSSSSPSFLELRDREKSSRHEFPHCHPGRYRQHLGVTKVVQGLHRGVPLCLERSRWPVDAGAGPQRGNHHLNIPSPETHHTSVMNIQAVRSLTYFP